MLRKFGSHLRDQWMGAVALFLVLSGGTAYAVTQIDNNSVRSPHIINDQVKSVDVRDDTLAGGGLVRQDLAPDSVGGSEVDDGTLTGAEILNSSLGGDDIAGLTGADIDETTLTTLDGHDAYDENCDPGNEQFLVCDEIAFTLGRPMEVSVSWAYAMGTDGDVNANGECRTTLDGAPKSNTLWLSSEDDSDFSHGGIPVVDVMSLSAGNHKVGFECREHQPEGKDLVIRDLTMSVVELGFD